MQESDKWFKETKKPLSVTIPRRGGEREAESYGWWKRKEININYREAEPELEPIRGRSNPTRYATRAAYSSRVRNTRSCRFGEEEGEGERTGPTRLPDLTEHEVGNQVAPGLAASSNGERAISAPSSIHPRLDAAVAARGQRRYIHESRVNESIGDHEHPRIFRARRRATSLMDDA